MLTEPWARLPLLPIHPVDAFWLRRDSTKSAFLLLIPANCIDSI